MCEAKVCHRIPPHEKTAPTDIHQYLLNVNADQTVAVSTVRQCVVHFSSGDSDVKKTCSGQPCTAITPQNEERLKQLDPKNLWITTRKLCVELNISFSELETVVTLKYHKVCTRWVPQMLTREQKHFSSHDAIIPAVKQWVTPVMEIFVSTAYRFLSISSKNS